VRRPDLPIALVLVVGVAGTAVAVRSREANPQFAAQQEHVPAVTAASLQRLMLTTSDPRPGYGGRAREARCASAGAHALGNPWTCVLRYPWLPRVGYRVTVHADGSIYGSGRGEGEEAGAALTVRGCCVGAP
jgi:hypothetical protein